MTALNLIPQLCDELRARILLEDRRATDPAPSVRTLPEDLIARQLDLQVATYVALARAIDFPPIPDFLPRLGWPGMLLHAACCETAGMWGVFRRLVARRHPEFPYSTPLTKQDVKLASAQELLLYQAFLKLPGDTFVEVHPALPDGSLRQADFLLTGATGQSVYVEVAMVASNSSADNFICVEYRERLIRKLEAYDALGLKPVVIWADQVAPPRVLTYRINEVLDRLGLASRPSPTPAWFEANVAKEAA